MNNLTKEKAILYLVAIFLAGAATGTVVGYTSGKHKAFPMPRPGEMVEHIVLRLQTRLELRPEQLGRIKPLVEQTCSEMQAIHRESWRRVSESFKKLNQQIAEHLDPAQRKRLEEMEKERREMVRKKCGPRSNGEPGAPRDAQRQE
jgi:hypothetical protein